MLKIGELAKICNVSASTLRFYDTEGLLCPDYIDEESGYRYYGEEKIQTFRKIETLKEMNFSLDEIKQVLDSGKSDNLYIRKIAELTEKISDMKWQIRRMRKICGFKGEPMLSVAEIKGRFENDPAVIGRWALCGELTNEETLEYRETEENSFPQIYFLPGGAGWWVFFWSAGVLYRMLSASMVIPENYRIAERGGEKYMLLDWTVVEGDQFEEMRVSREIRLLYRQMEAREFSHKEALIYKDDTDLPFVPDEEAVGSWEACDFIEDPKSFNHRNFQTPKNELFYKGAYFSESGTCTLNFRMREPINLSYTKGYIINKWQYTVSGYSICKKGNEKYLIAEHKSGDYSFGGTVRGYYVFKKVK